MSEMPSTGPVPIGVAAVRATGVSKLFRGRSGDVSALEDVDLNVAEGEFVSLIGPSGCGKSTLLRLIADLDSPTAGTLEVFGKTARQARIDQEYGIAFQQAGLLPWRSVRANIELPLELHGSSRSERTARSAELLELVGLAGVVPGPGRPLQVVGEPEDSEQLGVEEVVVPDDPVA